MSNDYRDPFCRRNPYSMINVYEQTHDRLREQSKAGIAKSAALATMLDTRQPLQPVLPERLPVSTSPVRLPHANQKPNVAPSPPQKKEQPSGLGWLGWTVVVVVCAFAAYKLLMAMM